MNTTTAISTSSIYLRRAQLSQHRIVCQMVAAADEVEFWWAHMRQPAEAQSTRSGFGNGKVQQRRAGGTATAVRCAIGRQVALFLASTSQAAKARCQHSGHWRNLLTDISLTGEDRQHLQQPAHATAHIHEDVEERTRRAWRGRPLRQARIHSSHEALTTNAPTHHRSPRLPHLLQMPAVMCM